MPRDALWDGSCQRQTEKGRDGKRRLARTASGLTQSPQLAFQPAIGSSLWCFGRGHGSALKEAKIAVGAICIDQLRIHTVETKHGRPALGDQHAEMTDYFQAAIKWILVDPLVKELGATLKQKIWESVPSKLEAFTCQKASDIQ